MPLLLQYDILTFSIIIFITDKFTIDRQLLKLDNNLSTIKIN